MRHALLCLIVLAGCASTDVTKMSAPELCFTRQVDEDVRPKADAEIARRGVDCAQHAAEVKQLQEYEERAGGMPVVGDGKQSSGGEIKGGYGTRIHR